MDFHYNTSGKLREIFAEHCNLSAEQYGEISDQFRNLVTDIQEEEPQVLIDKRIDYLRAVLEFLYNTKELTLDEHYRVGELLDDVIETWTRTAAILATEERRVL